MIPKQHEIISSAQEHKRIKADSPTLKDIIDDKEGVFRLIFFLISIPLTLIVVPIYLINFFLPLFVSIPLGLTVGLLIIIKYLDKLKEMLK